MDYRRFLQHFLANERFLTGYLLAATGNFHDSEDLLQEVSVALWESFDRYDERRPFQAWALGVARHKVLDYKSRQGRKGSTLSMDVLDRIGQAAMEEAPELGERRPRLQRCLEELPEHLRGMIDLRYRDGLGLEELAGRLKRSVAAVQMAFVRIRRSLRDCVERKLAQGTGAGG